MGNSDFITFDYVLDTSRSDVELHKISQTSALIYYRSADIVLVSMINEDGSYTPVDFVKADDLRTMLTPSA